MSTLPSLASLISRLRMRHLRLIIALDELGTVQKAADAVSMTQPGATKSLGEIEAMLGVQLFHRTYKGVETTVMGHCAVRYARLMHTDLAHFLKEMDGILQGHGGRLSVGHIMGAVPLTSAALAQVHAIQPSIAIEVIEDTSARLLRLLDQGRIDVAICRSTVNQQSTLYNSLDIHREELAVICNPDNPLTQHASLTLSELAQTSWIVYPANMPMRLLLEREFHEAGLQFPRYPVETASAFTSITMLRNDRSSVALMSIDAVAPFAEAGMAKILPIRLKSRSEPYELVTRKDTVLAPATLLFMSKVAKLANLNADIETHVITRKYPPGDDVSFEGP